MKNKILTFIIGVLVGAIIATTGFFIYAKSTNGGDRQMPQEMTNRGNGGERPEMPTDGETPPEMPSNQNQTTTENS